MMYLFKFKGCGRCSGDLTLDVDEWSCFQCGAIYYPERQIMELQLDPRERQHSMSTTGSTARSTGESDSRLRHPRARRLARHLDISISTARANDEAWWNKNQRVIHLLDQGKKVQEIADIVGQGPRQIRGSRERLLDFRSIEPELAAAE